MSGITVVVNARRAAHLPTLLESLRLAGVQDVLVVRGPQCRDAEVPGTDALKILDTDEDSEAAGLKLAMAEVQTDWLVYLQDATVVGAEFPARVAEVCRMADAERVASVRLLDLGSAGVYRTKPETQDVRFLCRTADCENMGVLDAPGEQPTACILRVPPLDVYLLS